LFSANEGIETMANRIENEAAEVLVAAWRSGQRLTDLPEALRPPTVNQAYAIQDAFVRLHGPIGGWKVAPAQDENDPLCSPIPEAFIFESPATLPAVRLPAPEVEVELAIRFAHALPGRSEPYDASQVTEAIGSVHPAIEVLSSRFEDRNAVSPLTSVADIQNHGAMVVGSGRDDWRPLEFSGIAMTLSVDRQPVAGTDGGASTAAVLDALAWLANHAVRRDGGLKAGQFVITGSRVGPVPVAPGSAVEADVDGIGRLALTID
jgi:2-keto-4-pentenoate hydratase